MSRGNSNKKSLPERWKKEIEKTGKFFEQKIAVMVQKSGFGYVVPNYAFSDIEEGGTRELDIFAISARRIGRKWNFIFPVLLIAVTKKALVCFTREEMMSIYTLGDIHFSGMPKTIYYKGEQYTLSEFLNLDRFHHYYKYPRISSQFWIPPQGKKSNRETTQDYLYKWLILPLIKAIISEKEAHEKEWFFDPEEEPINLQLYYPIIVVEELWECGMTPSKPVYSQVDSIGFVFHSAGEKTGGDYIIDICTEAGLKRLLKTIDKEADKIVDKIKKQRKVFENSAFAEARKREIIKK